MKEVSDNKILQMLREEKEMKLSGGVEQLSFDKDHLEGFGKR